MTLNYSANSLEAYLSACKNKNEIKILKCFKDYTAWCYSDLISLTLLSENVVSARINDLRHKQILTVSHKGVNNGRTVNFYKLKTKTDPDNTFNEGTELTLKLANLLVNLVTANTITIPCDYIIINKKN